MKEYLLYPEASLRIFSEACAFFKKQYPFFEKKQLLEDVDGSLLQYYTLTDFKVIIILDLDWESEIIIKTDIALDGFIKKWLKYKEKI
ncbi:MAG: hypothetical protein IJB74_03025 [Clostridia bacterium]|nr:hypothetical protein [Clostridia bacterium]